MVAVRPAAGVQPGLQDLEVQLRGRMAVARPAVRVPPGLRELGGPLAGAVAVARPAAGVQPELRDLRVPQVGAVALAVRLAEAPVAAVAEEVAAARAPRFRAKAAA